MAAFEYRQALEIRDACARHQVKYLFIGKSGAILRKNGPFDLDLIFAPTRWFGATGSKNRRRHRPLALPGRYRRP
jgi:hypothetical protein